MAGNTLTNIMQKILARALVTLREQCTMPRIVNGDYSNEAAKKGQTIDIPIPSEQTAYDITPQPNQTSAAGVSPGLVQIQLNNWKGTSFGLTDKEMVEIDRNLHFMPMQMTESIRALSNAINASLHQNYHGIYGFVGTAGTTPFASTVTAATDARKVLNQQRAFRTDRRMVLDFDAEANALALAQFSDADKIGTNQVRIEGEIGRKYGFDIYTDDNVVTHTAGSLSTPGAVVGSTTASGLSTLDIKSASAVGNIVKGDIFTIAGHSQTYTVASTVSAITSGTNKSIAFTPALKTTVTAAAAITIKGTHVVNLAMHRDCMGLAMRPLVSSSAAGGRIMSMTDPKTGITLRLELIRQNKQDKWELDVLWGDNLVRAALGTRIAG